MSEKEENFKKFIKLTPEISEKNRIITGGGSSPRNIISKEDFQNKLTNAISFGTIRYEELEKTYFFLELHRNYYSEHIKNTLKKLNLEIETVFEPQKILVSGKTEKINIRNLDELPNYVFESVKDIKTVESSDKIGVNLRKIFSGLREDQTININMEVLDSKDLKHEKLIQYIKSILKDESLSKEIKYYEDLGIISCSCRKSSIDNFSKSPIIKKIFLPPKAKKVNTEISQKELIEKFNNLEFKVEEKRDLPTICLIDSGISEIFEDYVIINDNNIFNNKKDNIDSGGHGTKVASLALFGFDLLEKKKLLKNQSKLISYKIEDVEGEANINLVIEIINAIKKYSDKTKIFSISYADPTIDPEVHISFINRLDKFIQEKNVIVCVSAGNVDPNDIYTNISKYPQYLKLFPVLHPSDGKNIFSIGSICKQTLDLNRLILSTHTRIGLSPTMISKIEDKSQFFKPNVHTYGGNNMNGIGVDPLHELPVINKYGHMVYDAGTSFATPLIALMLAKLYNVYQNDYGNSETYKAILLNKCEFDEFSHIPIFYYINFQNITEISDNILINFEGKLEPLLRIEDNTARRKKERVSRGHIIKFFLPKETESIDIITVHSSNYQNNNVLYHNTRLIVKIIKSNGVALQKKYGTPSRFSPITFGHYTFQRNFEGVATVEITTETRGISDFDLSGIKIRYGVSLKLNLKEENRKNIKSIYNEILRLSKLKSKIEQPSMELELMVEH